MNLVQDSLIAWEWETTYDYMLARGYEDGAELVGLIDSTQSDYLFQYHMMS